MFPLFRLCDRGGELPPGVVDGIVSGEDELGDGDQGVALIFQVFQNGGQGLGGMLAGVVEQDDGAGSHALGDPTADLLRADARPVQTVPAGKRCK